MQIGERLRLVLAPTINLDDTPTDGTYNAVKNRPSWRTVLYFAMHDGPTLAFLYEHTDSSCAFILAGHAEQPQDKDGRV